MSNPVFAHLCLETWLLVVLSHLGVLACLVHSCLRPGVAQDRRGAAQCLNVAGSGWAGCPESPESTVLTWAGGSGGRVTAVSLPGAAPASSRHRPLPELTSGLS